MAEDVVSVTGTVKQGIARIELFVDVSRVQDDWLVTVHFEDAFYDGTTGEPAPGSAKFDTRIINRVWSQIKDDPEVVAIADAMRDKIYEWRAEDIAAEEANPPPLGTALKVGGIW